jgi:hypothetical protein
VTRSGSTGSASAGRIECVSFGGSPFWSSSLAVAQHHRTAGIRQDCHLKFYEARTTSLVTGLPLRPWTGGHAAPGLRIELWIQLRAMLTV